MVPHPNDVPRMLFTNLHPKLDHEKYAFIHVTPSVSYSRYTTLL